MAHDLRVVDLDLMPLKLADLEARVAALPDLGDAEDWAMSYWYDYLWDGDVFMPEDDEPGDEMWARVAGEIAALARPATLTREQAWAIGALAFSCCGHELHERIWPGEDGAVVAELLLARPFAGLSPPERSASADVTPNHVSFGWLENAEIAGVRARLPEQPELVQALEAFEASGDDVFAIGDCG